MEEDQVDKKKNRRILQRTQTEDLVDMEQSCGGCGQKLYAPVSQAQAALQTVNNGGTALLLCVCGTANFFWRKQKLHD